MPPQHRGAAEMHFPGLLHDRLMEREALKLVVFAEEDPKQDAIARNPHGQAPFIILRVDASMEPAQTAIRHNATDRPILPPARNHSPSFTRLSVCKLNEENVVKPPQMPTITNCRAVEPTKTRPSGPV